MPDPIRTVSGTGVPRFAGSGPFARVPEIDRVGDYDVAVLGSAPMAVRQASAISAPDTTSSWGTRSAGTASPTIRPARRPCGGRTRRSAVRFLRHCHQADPDMADLFEFLIGTGLRKDEALGLHWDDVHLTEGVLHVRYTLSAIDNNHLVITAPKTCSSRNLVAISPRVAAALRHRARSRNRTHRSPGDPFAALVFCRPDGRPLRPHCVLDRLRQLSDEAGVPRVTGSRPMKWCSRAGARNARVSARGVHPLAVHAP
ncbi:tyrosine-type recombinase/integrase [Streptomyces sp. NPDC047043]|uniref:tyrosine-type recombinase/integrase n=1 Tax=Streptomyces sp. NPDC047043 TaxID=3154497 RepID=UPI00340208B3